MAEWVHHTTLMMTMERLPQRRRTQHPAVASLLHHVRKHVQEFLPRSGRTLPQGSAKGIPSGRVPWPTLNRSGHQFLTPAPPMLIIFEPAAIFPPGSYHAWLRWKSTLWNNPSTSIDCPATISCTMIPTVFSIGTSSLRSFRRRSFIHLKNHVTCLP